MALRTLLIDNYDSYTYNLFQLLAEVSGAEPIVYKNDAISMAGIQSLLRDGTVQNIVISPGPGSPEKLADIGVCMQVLQQLPGVPVLGVCLGHQALAVAAGGRVVPAPEPVHGRLSTIHHNGHALMEGIASGEGQGFEVVRYHSLVVEASSLPQCLEPIAWAHSTHHAVARIRPKGASPSSTADGNTEGLATSSGMQTANGDTSHGPAHALHGTALAASPQHATLPDQAPLIMAVAHKSRPHYGVQFHPESICTRYGMQLLLNFHRMSCLHLGLQYMLPRSVQVTGCAPGRVHEPHPWPSQQQSLSSRPLGLLWRKCVGAVKPQDASEGLRLFEALFAWRPHTFWLDSATMDRGRVSFMGAQGGPLWRAITYHLPAPAAHPTPSSPATGAVQPDATPSSPLQPPSAAASSGPDGLFKPSASDLHPTILQPPAEVDVSLLPLADINIPRSAWAPGTGTVYVQDGSGRVASGRMPFFHYLRQLLDTHQLQVTHEAAEHLPFNFWGGLVGYLGYELKAECGGVRAHASATPDAGLLFADRLLAVDHATGDVFLLAVHDQRQPPAGNTCQGLQGQGTAGACSDTTQPGDSRSAHGEGALAAHVGGMGRHGRQGAPAVAVGLQGNDTGPANQGTAEATPADLATAWLDDMEQRVRMLSEAMPGTCPDTVASKQQCQGEERHTGVACMCRGSRPATHVPATGTKGGASHVPVGQSTASPLAIGGLPTAHEAHSVTVCGTQSAGRLPATTGAHALAPAPDATSHGQEVQSATALEPSVSPEAQPSAGTNRTLRLRHPKQRYLDNIAACISALHSGESYEVCLTTALVRRGAPPPHTLYRALRSINPAPYGAWINLGMAGPTICCSSPERFLRGDRGGVLEARPIKGTAARHLTDARADAAAAADLERSEKDRAENLMIVDLLRNDLGQVCEVGSVHVPGLMEIESYATVHQMVSTVRGLRRREATLVDALQAAFPAGSMTGAPKIRTMAIIDTLEAGARGVYSGCVGFISLNDCFDLNVVIRTAVIDTGARLSHSQPLGTQSNSPLGTESNKDTSQQQSGDPTVDFPAQAVAGSARPQVHGTGGMDVDDCFSKQSGTQGVGVAGQVGLDEAIVSIGAGGAIVVQSELEGEFQEMCLKARALLAALGRCDGEGGSARLDDTEAWTDTPTAA